jgi:alpha-L-fucosidase
MLKSLALVAAIIVLLSTTSASAQDQRGGEMRYEPTLESLSQRTLPEWFEDAKLGLFVNWGLYSVPAWAPTTADAFHEVGDSTWFANNSYAEWYWNTMRIDDSPGQVYHRNEYGESFAYEDFAPVFKEELQGWSPEPWADLFEEVGARYVVFDTKHHDGFLLWPSRHTNPHKEDWQVDRDLPGELADAVRERGMRFGVYYSGGIDWSFAPVTVTRMADLEKAVPQSESYGEYATAHYYELIERYKPSVLWNDISFPRAAPKVSLFADYYNEVPDGVINDRWGPFQELTERMESGGEVVSEELPYDFTTPEYQVYDEITQEKWEATRGLGLSFGYNKNTRPENMLSVEELVHLFVDIVSKNGNLLLNVGPMADGTIPELQIERLRGLGSWLSTNGEAIFGTRPWLKAESQTASGTEIRFTQKGEVLYAVLFDAPNEERVVIENILVEEGAKVQILGQNEDLTWQQVERGLEVQWPNTVASAPAYTLKITPEPRLLQQD